MTVSLTSYEEKTIQSLGIYKGDILKLLILSYKKQNTKYNLKQLTQLSRKSLTSLKREIKKSKEVYKN